MAVGDCLVADGHTFNAEILNPWTGKPQRMTLILFYEMRANYPLGWEIMPTENTQAIAAALRRAILRLGKLPLCVYLDNGRAFGAKHFTANLAESGLAGLFERLGIETIFARPYHAQSKTVERFFGNFAELERRFPSYTGTCIEQKPARLHRNEKLHQRMHTKITGDFVPSIEQAHRTVAGFFDDYVERESKRSRYLKGKCPREIFEAGAGPGVDAGQLSELMMTMEIRSIRRSEISLPGPDGPILYRHAELYGRRHQAMIRYDLQDRSRILVHETSGEFICEARPATEVHPLARVTGTEADREELKAEMAGQKRLIKSTLAAARAFTEAVIVPEGRALLESRGLAGEEGSKFKVQSSKLVALPDMAAIEVQVEEAQRRQAAETVQAAAGFWRQLRERPEQERYETLLELEIQGRELPREELAFMRYFEKEPTYQMLKDYFEDRRLMFSLGG
jgi:putative transposase